MTCLAAPSVVGLAGGMGALAALIVGDGLAISTMIWDDAVRGAFTIGIGIAFVTWGTSYVPAAEVSLLVLIERVGSGMAVAVPRRGDEPAGDLRQRGAGGGGAARIDQS